MNAPVRRASEKTIQTHPIRHTATTATATPQTTPSIFPDLHREWNRARPRQRERQPSEHDKIGVKPDTLDPADAEHREPVVVLQAAELALYGGAAAVEVRHSSLLRGMLASRWPLFLRSGTIVDRLLTGPPARSVSGCGR